MTPEEFVRRMRIIEKDADQDMVGAHFRAEAQMCEVLDQLGYGEGIEVFRNMPKGYYS